MDRIGEQLLTESRASLSKDNGKVEKSAFKGRDLLSVLLKANMATDIMPSQRMSDAEVLARKLFRYYRGTYLTNYRGPNVPSCWARNNKFSNNICSLRFNPGTSGSG